MSIETATEGEEVQELWYCESRRLLLRMGQLYRFRADPECESCQALKREHDEAYGPSEPAQEAQE